MMNTIILIKLLCSALLVLSFSLSASSAKTGIVFISDRDNNYEVYTMDLTGQNQKRLTQNSWEEKNPFCSPDGSLIYASHRSGNADLYRRKHGSATETRLTTGISKDSFPRVSPRDGRIAFASQKDGNWDLLMMNADGSSTEILAGSDRDELSPCFSPDGSKIVYEELDSEGAELMLLDLDTGMHRRIVEKNKFNISPCFFPDGEWLVYASNRDGNWELYKYNLVTEKTLRLTFSTNNELSPVVSPDGRFIVYVFYYKDKRDMAELFIMDQQGGNQKRLTSPGSMNFDPMFFKLSE